jgi:RNA polymerase sigma-70 factor (ECF subfamily)
MTVDWADVYRRTYQDLVRFLHRMVWDADRAQDLAQEAFARALGQSPDNPRAWLFRVASNLATDEARSAIRRKKHLVLIKGEAEARQETGPDPHERLEQRERVEAVRRALESLGERDREALLLWNAGLNYQDIADATGLAAGAIGTTLARARRRLVEAYDALEKRHVAH